MNTISLMLMHKNSSRRSKIMLLVDALAPVAGALVSTRLKLSGTGLIIYLGFFAGFLLYMGASEILPEAHSKKSSYSTVMLTILGVAMMYTVSLFL
jgi:zinc transporter ZupT